MSITVHPITVDPATQEPKYTAQDYRHSVNSLLFPSNGSTFNSLNCVSAASPTHVLTVSGSVVTVVPHSGFMSPFAGEAAYTYTITDVDGENRVTMTAATGHYKIAVVVTDPSAGQGSTPGARLAAYSSSTADSAIPGIVLGEYNNGTVTDTAVRWQNQGVLIASTLTQLNTMAAPNHQLARVNGVEYERKNGAWVPVTQAPVVQAGTISAKSTPLAVIRLTYASPNGRPPDSLVVSLGPFDVEASAKQASVMVWSMTAEEAQIRVRRNYDGAWWPAFQATISWIAVWNA